MEYIWLLIVGCGIGWLMGLSESPVVGTVLGGLITVIAGIFAASKGNILPVKTDKAASVSPLAILVLGICLAAPLGIWARENAWFGRETRPAADNSGQGALGTAGIPSRSQEAGLHTALAEQCGELMRLAAGADIALFTSTVRQIFPLGQTLASTLTEEQLKRVVRTECENPSE